MNLICLRIINGRNTFPNKKTKRERLESNGRRGWFFRSSKIVICLGDANSFCLDVEVGQIVLLSIIGECSRLFLIDEDELFRQINI